MGVSTEEDTEDGKIFFKESQYIKCLFSSGAVPSIVCVIQLKAGFLWLRTSCTCSVVHAHPGPALWQTKKCPFLCCQLKSADYLDYLECHWYTNSFLQGLPGALLPLRKERLKTPQTQRLFLQKSWHCMPLFLIVSVPSFQGARSQLSQSVLWWQFLPWLLFFKLKWYKEW